MNVAYWIHYICWKVRLVFPRVTSVKLTGRRLLESWSALDALPVGRTCRAVRLLDVRSFELKSGVHQVLDQVWKRLVQVDIDSGTITIQEGNGGKCYHSRS